MGVVIGVIVLLVSIGFVVLMAYSEWSSSGQGSAPSPQPLPAASSSRKKPSKRPGAKKKPK